MKLLEYEAKDILRRNNISVPDGKVVSGSDTLAVPSILKAQVPVGGRGKAGGIAVVRNQAEADEAFGNISALSIAGYTPSCIYAEELLDIERELYFSLSINRDTSSIELIAHPIGGVDIEAHSADSFLKTAVTKESIDGVGQTVADFLGINPQAFLFTDMLEKLYKTFVEQDMTLLEINPLALTKEKKLVAADCKMELDDNARFRHPEWDFEDTPTNSNFITLDQQGTIATIANGAGLAMATVDAVADSGLVPANFLDIGGGANEASVTKAFIEIMKYPNIHAIIINIFAGITRCDEVARAIVAATKNIEHLPPLFIRLDGTNHTEAAEILREHDISMLASLEACIDQAKKVQS